MDTPQLKRLAGLVRGLLEQHEVNLGHSQALDTIAALPGLRNWPEVQAFPERVAAAELDEAATGRLAYRLKSKFDIAFQPLALLLSLQPPSGRAELAARVPQVWPGGPKPGVYVTTRTQAIDALMAKYEDATDGGVAYGEEVGSNYEAVVELGEHGLSSYGLNRVPTGTLILVGPVELNQSDWEESASKVGWACLRALNNGHRVAVLVNTPSETTMFADLMEMVRSQADGKGEEEGLVGIVDDLGDLVERTPFVPVIHSRGAQAVAASRQEMLDDVVAAASPELAGLLSRALERRHTGLLSFGTTYPEQNRGMEQMSLAIALTEHLGPAARVKSHKRGTPAKDWDVPPVIAELPFLPSLESALAQGYKRLIVDASYTDLGTLLMNNDVLVMTSARALSSGDLLMATCRSSTNLESMEPILAKTIALVGLGRVEGRDGVWDVLDGYIGRDFETAFGRKR